MSIKATPLGHSRILSVGTYRPKRAVPNSEIVDRIESTDEWIQQRTGIESRRFAGDDETVISMAKAACEMALKRAKLSIEDIDTVILSTISYPFQAPSAATELINELGNPKAAAFDISAACAGFCYGVAMGSDLVRSGTSKNVLVIGVEKLSDYTDPDDRATAFIFADGAGAVEYGSGSFTPSLVSTWLDKSGFNHHASQSKTQRQPTLLAAGINNHFAMNFSLFHVFLVETEDRLLVVAHRK